MKKYYVYYDYGYCHHGDHTHGIDEYDTLSAAIKRADELDKKYGSIWNAAEVFAGHSIDRTKARKVGE